MTNDSRTRHLIVKLPDVTGEEADLAIEEIETYLGDTMVVGATASHALGETVLAGGVPGVRARRQLGGKRDGIDVWMDRYLTADEARELAGALLILADEVGHE